jgi:NAD(P)-dependent dehydrogenase (short-subunit alcohol dehydrogenase family)
MNKPAAPRVVVITGASAGIGRATAIRFAREGASVALLARGEAGLAGAAAQVEAAGGRALPIATDVADFDQVEAAAQRVEDELGPIDVWINCAMATIFSPVSRITPAEFRRATEVTYLGTVHGTLCALERMRARNRGTIVQVGSALSYRAIPLQAPYCAAKFAIRGFTDALRVELMHDNSRIHLTMVQLSAFNTPQFLWGRTHLARRPQPVPPIFDPKVAAEGIHFAARARRREVWVGFPAVKAILGNRLAAWFADRVLVRQGYAGQMTERPVSPGRPDNLFAPAAGDFGVDGPYGERARPRSWQLWASMHRGALLGAGLIVLGATAVAARRLRR